jgi:hypothetical protein
VSTRSLRYTARWWLQLSEMYSRAAISRLG